MTQTNLTLEQVQADFAEWRCANINRRIPQTLRQQAISLCQNYKASDIRKALGVTLAQIRNWQKEDLGHDKNTVAPNFVAIELPDLAMTQNTLNVTVRHPYGAEMEITGLNTNQLCAVIHSFNQGASQ